MNNCTTMMNETTTNNNTRDIIIYEEKSKKNYDSYEIFTKSGVQRIQFKLNGKPYMKKKTERKGFTITKEEIDYLVKNGHLPQEEEKEITEENPEIIKKSKKNSKKEDTKAK